ncbi:sulfurtransferase TusA family protein [Thermaerobacter subterraneus]|uniref:Rhodanese-related sulfurtransferase n=1 Tax=Thermaerobacter subterraneus DSM 13965 TaxID=867903 RepID=K6QD71_9FIRM|nr:sulfurtransferase TusA family protein [Thermaerobacter subterraneus]EKP94576.1 Rhodanese-related sulfurtransferase [Thermaerobacter subterraneus DSM 13965]
MNATFKPSATVDARGLSCPLPIVRARKAIDALQVGEILEVLATDKGAPADFRGWCEQTEHKFLGVVEDEGFLRLYVKKLVPETKEKGQLFDREISSQELARRLEAGDALTVLDVREPEEYEAGHIPGALSVPIETLSEFAARLDRTAEIAVVCRSGRRSAYACRILQQAGFEKVVNVVPGMSAWSGPVEQGGAGSAPAPASR